MLTASSFPSTFGILKTVQLDDQVDAQPLVVPGSQIANGSLTTDDVVYVATENNTVYAIDASTGAILLSRNFGSPVPNPLGATAVMGRMSEFTGTPVIDLARKPYSHRLCKHFSHPDLLSPCPRSEHPGG